MQPAADRLRVFRSGGSVTPELRHLPQQRVTGTRKDAWAIANPIVVERDKSKREKRNHHVEAHPMLCE
jgi:hypothetical protein